MRKWMFPLLFLLTALLLVSLAFLPALAGVLQDTGTQKTVSYRPLHSIAPYIREKGSGLVFSEKLAVLQESEVSSIVPALASMTEQQARAAVEAGMQPYVEAGIVRPFESCEYHAIPCVAISWQDAQRWFLFWSVSLVEVSGDSKTYLSCRVDDETGKLLSMEYYDPYALEDRLLWDEKCLQLDQFTKIWLEQAGLWDRVRPAISDFGSQQFQGMHTGLHTTVYELCDGVESPLYIYFSLTDYGEYMMWFESMPQ